MLYKEVTVSPSHALIVEIPHTLMLRGTEREYKSLRFVQLLHSIDISDMAQNGRIRRINY